MSVDRDYYCSYKFKYLKIDLVSNATYNCHAAKQHAINFQWVANNKGNLFNTDINVAERQMMLANKLLTSCTTNLNMTTLSIPQVTVQDSIFPLVTEEPNR